MNLKNILPKGGPAIDEVDKYIAKYNDDFIVIKCGGSVLLDEILFNQLIEDISILNNKSGYIETNGNYQQVADES